MIGLIRFFYLFLFVIFQSINLPAILFTDESKPYTDIAYSTAGPGTDLSYGFSISGGIGSLRTSLPISKRITFGKDDAVLNLMADAVLDSNVTLSFWTDGLVGNKGYISGNKNSILLNGDLVVPSNCDLVFLTDSTIDGKGKNLILGDGARLIVDSHVTLSLKNLNIKTGTNSFDSPPITMYEDGNLTLQSSTMTLGSDFSFDKGSLYINDTVSINGASDFVFSSTQGCYINTNSKLKFNLDTKFTYSPYSDSKDLITMKDSSSKLILKGSTVQTTHTGLRITKGNLIFDKSVTVSSLKQNIAVSSSVTTTKKLEFAENQRIIPVPSELFWIRDVEFNNNGKFVVAGGIKSGGGAGYALVYELDAYGNVVAQRAKTTFLGEVDAMSFSVNSDHLAVGGTIYSSKYGEIYSFDNVNGTLGSSPTTITAPNRIRALEFSGDRKYLAVGCSGLTSSQSACLLHFLDENYSIVSTTNIPYNQEVREVRFSPDNKFLVVVGAWDDGNGNYGQIYPLRDDGTIGTPTPIPYTSGGQMRAISFSPDGRYLAVGGIATGNAVRIYPFYSDGTLGTVMIVPHSGCSSLSFSPDGSFLYVDTSIFPVDLDLGYIGSPKQYSFSGSSIEDIDFSPDERSLAIGGGLWNVDRAAMYDFYPDYGYNIDTSYSFGDVSIEDTVGLEDALIIGDSTGGVTTNATVDVMPGATVTVYGGLVIDDVVAP